MAGLTAKQRADANYNAKRYGNYKFRRCAQFKDADESMRFDELVEFSGETHVGILRKWMDFAEKGIANFLKGDIDEEKS